MPESENDKFKKLSKVHLLLTPNPFTYISYSPSQSRETFPLNLHHSLNYIKLHRVKIVIFKVWHEKGLEEFLI
jgi:hypothetical protein